MKRRMYPARCPNCARTHKVASSRVAAKNPCCSAACERERLIIQATKTDPSK